MTKHNIEHETSQQCFHITQTQGVAVLKYYLDENNQSVNFYNTFVPDTLRNQGLAEKLVKHGLNWATKNNYAVTADCWYVQRFL